MFNSDSFYKHSTKYLINQNRGGLMKNLLIALILPLLLIACNNDNPVSSSNPDDNNPNDSTTIPKVSPLIGKWIEDVSDTLADSMFSSAKKKDALGYINGIFNDSTGLIDTNIWIKPSYPITYLFHQDSLTSEGNNNPLILTVALWLPYYYSNSTFSFIVDRPELYSTRKDTVTTSYLIVKDTLFLNYSNKSYNVRYVKEQ